MSSNKLSGAQNRKRKQQWAKEDAENAKRAKQFFSSLYKKSGEQAYITEEVEAKTRQDEVSDTSEDEAELRNVYIAGENYDETESISISGVPLVDNFHELKNWDELCIKQVIETCDIGQLQFNKETGSSIMNDNIRSSVVRFGLKNLQNRDGPFTSTLNRAMTSAWFYTRLANGKGEEVLRSYLAYSPSKGSAFCMCCLLFANHGTRSALELESGFNNWRKPERILKHENSPIHRQSFMQWKTLELSLNNIQTVDKALQEQICIEKQRWREVLARIISCIQYLAAQNLAFRGHRESISDESNSGNFLELLKLISKYDTVLANHVAAYLSPAIQSELIDLMANAVQSDSFKLQKGQIFSNIT